MVMSEWIFPTVPASVCPAEDRLLPSATGPPIGRATAPRPTHTAALGDLGEILLKIQQNERSSGSPCSAAARDPESLRAGIGPAEVGRRDPRRERSRNERRGPETRGERIPA